MNQLNRNIRAAVRIVCKCKTSDIEGKKASLVEVEKAYRQRWGVSLDFDVVYRTPYANFVAYCNCGPAPFQLESDSSGKRFVRVLDLKGGVCEAVANEPPSEISPNSSSSGSRTVKSTVESCRQSKRALKLKHTIASVIEEHALANGLDVSATTVSLPKFASSYKKKTGRTLKNDVLSLMKKKTGTIIDGVSSLFGGFFSFSRSEQGIMQIRGGDGGPLNKGARSNRRKSGVPMPLPGRSDFLNGAPEIHRVCFCEEKSARFLSGLRKSEINKLFGSGNWNALHVLAIQGGQHAKTKATALIKGGIDVSLKTSDGWTAEDLAMYHGRTWLAELIKNGNDSVNFEAGGRQVENSTKGKAFVTREDNKQEEGRSLAFLIDGGAKKERVVLPKEEDSTNEFKCYETMSKTLPNVCYRAITSFLNSSTGGKLWLGLHDRDAKIVGCSWLRKSKQRDDFQRLIQGYLDSNIRCGERCCDAVPDKTLSRKVEFRFSDGTFSDKGPVCLITVKALEEGLAWFNKTVFARLGNETRQYRKPKEVEKFYNALKKERIDLKKKREKEID